MSLRTSRWILRLLLFPVLVPFFVGPVAAVGHIFLRLLSEPMSVGEVIASFVTMALIGSIPFLFIYIIWKGRRASVRRRRLRQASREKAKNLENEN